MMILSIKLNNLGSIQLRNDIFGLKCHILLFQIPVCPPKKILHTVYPLDVVDTFLSILQNRIDLNSFVSLQALPLYVGLKFIKSVNYQSGIQDSIVKHSLRPTLFTLRLGLGLSFLLDNITLITMIPNYTIHTHIHGVPKKSVRQVYPKFLRL